MMVHLLWCLGEGGMGKTNYESMTSTILLFYVSGEYILGYHRIMQLLQPRMLARESKRCNIFI